MAAVESTSLAPFVRWQRFSPSCSRDLLIKKFALTIIGTLNLALVAWAIYEMGDYAQIALPTEMALLSPFIAGAIWGLEDHQLTLYGVTHKNFRDYTTPQTLLGRVLSYIFFAPFKMLISRTDLTDYSNPIIAKEISSKLQSDEAMDYLGNQHANTLTNMVRYGLLDEEELDKIYKVYKTYATEIKPVLDAYVKCSLTRKAGTDKQLIPEQIREQQRKLQTVWQQLHIQLPNPTSFDSLIITTATAPSCCSNLFPEE